jgi:hypothetical protein
MSSPKADDLVTRAEDVVAHNTVRARKAALVMLALILAGVVNVAVLGGWTLYEIHSCVTPGWPCNNRNAQQSSQIVGQLSQSHVEIQADLHDIKRLLQEMRQP